jgi:hypothetical protein
MTKTRDLADLGGGFIQAGSGAVQRTVESKLQDVVSVLDFIPPGTNTATTDCTTFIQAAIDAGAQDKKQVFIPSGNYLVTDTLNLPRGVSIFGTNQSQGLSAYASSPLFSKISFSPSSLKDLFQVAPPTPGSFNGHVSVGGLIIQAITSNGRYAFNLSTVIYGNFFDMEVIGISRDGSAANGWDAGFYITNSINNRFVNVSVQTCSQACVIYTGSAPPTTDVWDQCTFWNAPVGVRLESGINIRFAQCLFENLSTYGMETYKDCRAIEAVSCYSENVPSDILSTTGSMFRVGYSGSTSSLGTVLKVVGGSYAGRNIVSVGSFLDVDDAVGVLLVSPYVANFINLINATANTRDLGISIAGIQFNGIPEANILTGQASTKVSGFWEYRNVNNEGVAPTAKFDSLTVAGNVRLTPKATAPTSPSEGLIYYDDPLNKIRLYDGSNWNTVFSESSGRLLVGTSTSTHSGSGTAAKLVVSEDTTEAVTKLIGNLIDSGNATTNGRAQKYEIIRHYPVVSLGTKLIIPFVSQGGLNQCTICSVKGFSTRFNNSTPLGFEINFAVGHINSLNNLQSWGGAGNYSSIAINGMNIEITFTTAYTSATVDGLMANIEYMCYRSQNSIDVANITMN